jgi:tellurite resistance protein TerC
MEIWAVVMIVLQLIFLEGILSIDNAAILGAMVTPLSSDREVPWPKALAKIGHSLRPILGFQRMAALKVGLLGAYLGRGAMLFVASTIIHNPWIKLVGAAYLIRLAFEHLGIQGDVEGYETEGGQRIPERGFWATVLMVELMDLAFSVDNVVAAVSLSKELWVVFIGVALGILTMRYAAGLFSQLVEKEPILKEAAYILIFNIGVELILEDLAGLVIPDWLKFAISISTLLLAVAYARIPVVRKLRPVLVWFGQGFHAMNELINWALIPIAGIVKLLWRFATLLLPKKQPSQA